MQIAQKMERFIIYQGKAKKRNDYFYCLDHEPSGRELIFIGCTMSTENNDSFSHSFKLESEQYLD